MKPYVFHANIFHSGFYAFLRIRVIVEPNAVRKKAAVFFELVDARTCIASITMNPEWKQPNPNLSGLAVFAHFGEEIGDASIGVEEFAEFVIRDISGSGVMIGL